MIKNTAEVLTECLESEGVEYVFGIPGEENLDFMFALSKSNIKFIPVRHEQGGAFMAEAVRAGIEAIPKGQAEAASSQGFGYAQTMLYIVLPQTTKIMLPPMVNQIVALIKNTSCMYIIGGTDLITATYNFVKGEATGGAYGPAFLISALLFFLMCFPLSYLASNWEKKLKKRETQELLIRQPLARRSAFGNSLIAEEKQNPIKRFTERRETDGRISR